MNRTTVTVDRRALRALRDAIYERSHKLHGLIAAEASKALLERAKAIRAQMEKDDAKGVPDDKS